MGVCGSFRICGEQSLATQFGKLPENRPFHEGVLAFRRPFGHSVADSFGERSRDLPPWLLPWLGSPRPAHPDLGGRQFELVGPVGRLR